MANVKNITGSTGAAEERLVIIDEKISCASITRPITKEALLGSVNRTIKKRIEEDQFNKDIRTLRDKLKKFSDENQVEVTLINKRNTGYYYSLPNFKLFEKHIGESDKNLLLYANSLFQIFKGTSLQKSFQDIVGRLLDDSLTLESTEIPEHLLQLSHDNSERSKKWLYQLLSAIVDKGTLKVTYKNAKGIISEKYLCPYVIKQYNHKWYLIAYDLTTTRAEKVNVYAIDSMLNIESSGKKYIADTSFNAENYFKYSLGIWHIHEQNPVCVTLEFLNRDFFEFLINHPIHHSQTYILNETENKLVINIEVYDSPELYTMIYSYGAHVKVISPQSVVDKVKDNLHKALDLYL